MEPLVLIYLRALEVLVLKPYQEVQKPANLLISSQTNIEQINLNIKSLQLANCKSEISESYEYVTHNDQRYDIVFFDPPYKSNCYDWLDLALKKLLKPDGIIYIESATKIALDNLSMVREKKTKTLFYGIYKYDR